MKLPVDPTPKQRYQWGKRLLLECTRAGYPDLWRKVRPLNEEVFALGLAVAGCAAPLEHARVQRDEIDRQLADVACDVAARLTGHRAEALVLPNGLREYLDVPVAEEPARYSALADRIERHLPADDPIRAALAPQLRERVSAWLANLDAIRPVFGPLADATAAHAEAVDRWERAILAAYDTLVAREGAPSRADRFFPCKSRGGARSGASPADGRRTR